MTEYEYGKKTIDSMAYLIANYLCSTSDIVMDAVKKAEPNAKNFYSLSDKDKYGILSSLQEEIMKSLKREF